MFTGIIEDVGVVRATRAGDRGGRTLTVETKLDPASIGIGDSIAVNGVCLTVTRLEGGRFSVDAGPETLARTTTGALAVGDRVNLERALTLATRLGGHLVQGHVDELGRVRAVHARENAYDLVIDAPAELMRLVAPRGAITVDGISLTVTGVDPRGFSVSVIPHTWRVTSLSTRTAGSAVNLEADLLARYVVRLLETRESGGGGKLSEAFLAEHGFLS